MSFLQIVLTTLLFLLIGALWRRRWLYYYSWNMPGTLGWPLIGNFLEFILSPKDYNKILRRYFFGYPEVFKMWLGHHLTICTTNLDDVSTVLTERLEKSDLYVNDEVIKNGILVAPVSIWKPHRKTVNKTFNQRVLDTYTDSFVKISNKMIEEFKGIYQQGPIDMFPLIWKYQILGACETLLDVDSSLVTGVEEYVQQIKCFEDITLERVLSPWYHPSFSYKFSSIGRKLKGISKQMKAFMDRIIQLNKELSIISDEKHENISASDDLRHKRFLNYMLNREDMTMEEVYVEMHTVMMAGTSTSTYSLCFTLLLLAIHPEVQEKIYEELCSIFKDGFRDPILEELNRMEYLDRVMKESLRMYPPIPMVLRFIDKTLQTDSMVFPAGSNVMIPITKIHLNPELWSNPHCFDPDRFLPEKIQNKHRSAYLPFSYGARNCPGWKMALITMKITLATIVNSFIVKPAFCKKIEDIELGGGILNYPKNNEVVLVKRNFVKTK